MDIKKIAMVGAGSMGGMMSLLFAELGTEVVVYDPSEENVKALMKKAKDTGLEHQLSSEKDYESLCKALPSPKVFVFSLPHGSVGDKTVESLKPFLKSGDFIFDASNEYYASTERRQKVCEPLGVNFIGSGVSGGYQSARHGPSMSPGGNKEAVEKMLPFLRKAAAKDSQGRPCVAWMGEGGAGHYVKMVHNGIEQGMMSALCETWGIMTQCLGMKYEEIAEVFEEWDTKGELIKNFLVSIGSDICRTKDPKDSSYVLDRVKDKVVQDVDETEGTGTWTIEEGSRLHVSIPTITAAHMFRLSSADAAQRIHVHKSLEGHIKVGKINVPNKTAFIEDLRKATYAAFLMAFVQGLDLLEHINQEKKWNLDFSSIISIWRGGCIIQSDHISDLLSKVYEHHQHIHGNLLTVHEVGHELLKCYPSLKNVVLKAVEADAHVPSLSASLSYFRYSGDVNLPTQFMEAELDYFGNHMFDLKGAGAGKPVTGTHHFEWHPARGIKEEHR
ncbi:hypothetical protein MMC11_005416 [Xylographa trunciseda]|nr:hypothetical protein [Xylographa trunciseda]